MQLIEPLIASARFRWLWRWGLRVTGPVLLVVLLVRVVDYGELREIFGDLRISWVLAAIGMVQVLILLRTFRWMELHEAFDLPRAPLSYQIRVTYATSFATLVLPQIVNPLSRWVLLVQDGFRASRAAGASLLEKVLDLATFVAFGLYGSIFLASTFGALVWWALGATLAAVAVAAGAYLGRARLAGLATAVVSRLPGASAWEEEEPVDALRDIISVNRRVALRVAVWSLAIGFTQATLLYFLSQALGVGLSYQFMVAVWGVIALTMLLPLSVNGIGTREAVLVAAFSSADRSTDAAVALGLLVLVVVAIGSSPGALEWLRRFMGGSTAVGADGGGAAASLPTAAVASHAPGERSP